MGKKAAVGYRTGKASSSRIPDGESKRQSDTGRGKSGRRVLEWEKEDGSRVCMFKAERLAGNREVAMVRTGYGNGGKRERALEALFYLLTFAAIACFAMVQTYGDPPDEINRFKVVNYICSYGRLPHGADPEVILDGYGASYAFQPILTYMIQGFLLRFLLLFTSDSYVLLLAARMVNAVFGVWMAYYVVQIAKEAWKNPYLQWVFVLMTVFLPQNIFIHSYVNTDSMAMLSVAIIFYALLRAQRTGYGRRECVELAVGIILCAMSYYNAYGVIVAAMLVFFLDFVHGSGQKGVRVEWAPLLQKGAFISVIVLVGISWWFIRNGVLYDGDIIAMDARRECAIRTATQEFNPLTRETYQNTGRSVWEMLFGSGYLTLLRDSFIAMFGPMQIPTHGLIYLWYKRFWIVACAVAVLPVQLLWKERMQGEERRKKLVFYFSMALFCIITVALSIYYSYTWEYQPQGRYILPVLIPLMYLVTLGVEKICGLLEWGGKEMDRRRSGGRHVRMAEAQQAKGHGRNGQARYGQGEGGQRGYGQKSGPAGRAGQVCGKLFCLGIIGYVMLAFAYSLFVRFLPHYLQGENMFSMWGKGFGA